jgi:hypothetical protein
MSYSHYKRKQQRSRSATPPRGSAGRASCGRTPTCEAGRGRGPRGEGQAKKTPPKASLPPPSPSRSTLPAAGQTPSTPEAAHGSLLPTASSPLQLEVPSFDGVR